MYSSMGMRRPRRRVKSFPTADHASSLVENVLSQCGPVIVANRGSWDPNAREDVRRVWLPILRACKHPRSFGPSTIHDADDMNDRIDAGYPVSGRGPQLRVRRNSPSFNIIYGPRP